MAWREPRVGGNHAGAGGFSLVELSITLAIIAVFAAIAAPRFGNALARYRVQHAAYRLKADLQLVRETAVHRSRGMSVVFVTGAGSSYSVKGLHDPDRAKVEDYTVSLWAAPYHASLAMSVGGDDRILFDGFGMPDSAGRIRLSVGRQTSTVTISASTGNVEIESP